MLTKINFPDLKKTFGFGVHNSIIEDSFILPLIWEFYSHNKLEDYRYDLEKMNMKEFKTICDYAYVNCKDCYQEEIIFKYIGNTERKIIYKSGKVEDDYTPIYIGYDSFNRPVYKGPKEIDGTNQFYRFIFNQIKEGILDETIKVIEKIKYPYYTFNLGSNYDEVDKQLQKVPDYVLPDCLKEYIDNSITGSGKRYSEMEFNDRQIFDFLFFMTFAEQRRMGKFIIITDILYIRDIIKCLVEYRMFPIAQTFYR